MKTSIAKMHAPRCAHPDCKNLVSYHTKTTKADGTPGFKWKTFCNHHRTVGKPQRDKFIESKGGCENRDGRCGWVCGDPSTKSLTIDHWDGDKHNNDQDNLVVLCANCHNRKTKECKDSTKRYMNVNKKFHDLFDFV